MQIEFVTAPKIEEVEGAVAVIAYESALSGAGRDFDTAMGGAVTRAIEGGWFKAGKGQAGPGAAQQAKIIFR